MTRKYRNKNLPRGIQIRRGRVWVRFFPNGQHFYKCIGPVAQAGVIDQAIAKLNELRETVRLGKFDLQEKERRITVEQAVQTFWDIHASQKKSAKNFGMFLRNFLRFFGGRYIDSISRFDIQTLRAERLKSVSPSSFNKERACLVTLFNKLKEWKQEGAIKNVRLPNENPVSSVKRDNERIYARRRVLSQEEFDRFMQCADWETRRICLAAIHTTLRLKDLKALTLDNVNESTNQLEGTQAKTGKPYAIPINSVVRQVIEAVDWKIVPWKEIFNFANFRKQFEKAREKAGIENFQFRDLRRTGARMMLKKGADIATVSAYLGHANIAMTQVYVPPSQDDKRVAAELLGTSYTFNPDQNCNQNCNQQASPEKATITKPVENTI